MVQKNGQMRFTTTWLKKLIEFQGDVIGCEGRRQNAVTAGKKGLKEGGISLHLRNMWKVKKKNSETIWRDIIPEDLEKRSLTKDNQYWKGLLCFTACDPLSLLCLERATGWYMWCSDYPKMSGRAINLYANTAEPWHKWLIMNDHLIMKMAKIRNGQDKIGNK